MKEVESEELGGVWYEKEEVGGLGDTGCDGTALGPISSLSCSPSLLHTQACTHRDWLGFQHLLIFVFFAVFLIYTSYLFHKDIIYALPFCVLSCCNLQWS